MSTPEKTPHTPFRPTQLMIEATETLLLAMANEQLIRETVEAYKQRILAERRWEVSPTMLDAMRRRENPEDEKYVTDIKYAWMMCDADFAVYDQRCRQERIAANLHVQIDSQCPLLVAEELTRQAKYAMCDAMSPLTGIDGMKSVTLQLDQYDELIEKTLRLMAAFVTNPLAKPSNC